MRRTNLKSFIKLDKLFHAIRFGRIVFTGKLDDGMLSSLFLDAREQRLFNRSDNDKFDNEEALKYVLDRIVSFLEKNQSEKLTFEIFATNQKIRKIETSSQLKLVIDNHKKDTTI